MNLTSLYSHGIYSELATLLLLSVHFAILLSLRHFTWALPTVALHYFSFMGGGGETAISLVISLLRSTWICGFYIPSH